MWINNPGEYAYSGENRPSYWAGNDVMPMVDQKNNKAFYYFDLSQSEFKLIHLYVPFWKLDQIILKEKAAFLRKDSIYLAIIFNNPIEMTDYGPLKNREIKSFGEKHSVLIFVSTLKETNLTFQEFIENVSAGITYNDFDIEFYFNEEKTIFSKDKINNKPERRIF